MPKENTTIPFSLLLNLASVCHAEDPEIIWGFIEKYSPGTKLQNNKLLENMVNLSVVYFNDMIKPNKTYRLPDDNETKALKELSNGLIRLDKSSSSEEIQKLVFSIGKENNFENLNSISWDKGCYVGQEITARMKYRALLKKKIYTFNIMSGFPKKDQKIKEKGIDVGKIISVKNKTLLAMMKIEFVDSKLKSNKYIECDDGLVLDFAI